MKAKSPYSEASAGHSEVGLEVEVDERSRGDDKLGVLVLSAGEAGKHRVGGRAAVANQDEVIF